MTSEREWLEGRLHNDCVPYIPVREKLGNQRPAPYSMSQACHEIDELRVVCERWADDYTLLAEQADELRESRERLRIRVMELEGRIETQFGELREVYGENNALKQDLAALVTERDAARLERDNLRAKASYPKAGW